VDAPLHHSLAVLESQVKLVSRQLFMGPLTNDAIKSVVGKIDAVVVQLQIQKKLEIKKKGTCVSEKNDATQQNERRTTDKAKLDSEIVGFEATIQTAQDDISAIETQLEELNNTMTKAKETRQEAYTAYKASVQEQVDQQKVLNEAITAMKNFYASKKKEANLLQRMHTSQALPVSAPIGVPAAASGDKHAPHRSVPVMSRPMSPPRTTLDTNASKTQPAIPVAALHAQTVAKLHADPEENNNATPTLERTKGQQVLDDAVKNNMDTKWGDVKDTKANRTTMPKGFAKPLKAHGGGKGIIGILQIILEESEAMIEQEVKDEKSEVDLHLANMEQTKQLMAQKEREVVMLDQVESDNSLKLTQAEQQLVAVETEIKEIGEFILIVDQQCETFLENFDANQAARAQEISDTNRAKEVLLGMEEDTKGASVLAQLTRTIQRVGHGEQ